MWRLAAVGFDEFGTPERFERVVTPAEWISDVLRRDLTVHTTTFTDADVVEAVAQRLGGGSTVDTLERIVNIVLGSTQVIPVASDDGREWYTSREIRDVEQRFIAALGHVDERGPLDPALVAAAVGERPGLGEDQAAAVARVCGTDADVAVLIGPAGTGKTYTLDTVREVFEQAGWRVIGAGPSARAARELTGGAQIPARTLHTLAGDVARGLEELDGRTLLVVDEAGMADIRLLEETVTTTVSRGGRVLLVGDQHQMPAIGAGGGFAYAAEHGRCVAELTVNRRQREPWEQAALAELRNRSVAAAVAAYREHERVVVTADADTMVADAISRWAAAIEAGHRPVMLAGSNDLVDRLNRAAIEVLVARGELPDDDGTYGGERYRIGRGSRCAATATVNAPPAATGSRSPTVSSAPSSPSTVAGSPFAWTATPTSKWCWTSGTWPVAARSVMATPSPPTAPRAEPGTCRSPSASKACTGRPPTPTCRGGSPRTG